MSLVVRSKTSDTVKCEVIDGGELKSRRHLNVRGKSATLPSITGFFLLSSIALSLVVLVEIWILNFHFFILTPYISSEKDWEDIKFGVENKVDFYAVSFVKDAKVVHELKAYLKSNSSPIAPFLIAEFYVTFWKSFKIIFVSMY